MPQFSFSNNDIQQLGFNPFFDIRQLALQNRFCSVLAFKLFYILVLIGRILLSSKQACLYPDAVVLQYNDVMEMWIERVQIPTNVYLCLIWLLLID